MTSERKRLVKKLDILCRKILLKRDLKYGQFFRCISCHRLLPIEQAQVGHYISRRYESMRWDFPNIHLQCPSCNKWHSGNLIEYRKSLIDLYGENEVLRMENDYQQSPHYSVFDLEQMVREYQDHLENWADTVVDG